MLEQLRNVLSRWGAFILVVMLMVFTACISTGGSSDLISSAANSEEFQNLEYFEGEAVAESPGADAYQYRAVVAEGASKSAATTPRRKIHLNIGATYASDPIVPDSDATFIFTVKGRGHGVGLCMDGVLYRALAGQSAWEIINYYYTGVQLGSTSDTQPIRVRGRDSLVRTMPMNEYLYRLTEEPESYPMEGLKVLYIAARTYTLSCINRGKHAAQGFDICASGDCCQAFDENKDLSKYPNNIAAVKATAGQIITYNGQPIIAAYCGSCGGHTQDNEEAWGGSPIPYLRGNPDTFCTENHGKPE